MAESFSISELPLGGIYAARGGSLLFAAKRADALLEAGDLEGQRVWKGVLKAVEEVVRVKPNVGKRVN